MARPFKWRRIECLPSVSNFIPQKRNNITVTAENVLKLEELEAIRLKDVEGLEQGECANKMEVSRPTFQRILISARKKIADSLINGKMIRIEGGNFTRNICHLKCRDCGNLQTDSFENIEKLNGEYACNVCGSKNIVCVENCNGLYCRRNGRRRGRQI